MPALVAGIHVFTKAWMAGTSPAMTKSFVDNRHFYSTKSLTRLGNTAYVGFHCHD
jgi:hypothetical protein